MWNKVKDLGPDKIAHWIYGYILTPPFHGRKFLFTIFTIMGTVFLGIFQYCGIFEFEIGNNHLISIFGTLIQSLVTIWVVFIALDIIKIGWNLIADTIVYIFMLTVLILIFMIFVDKIIEQRLTLAVLFFIITSVVYIFYLSIKIAQNRAG